MHSQKQILLMIVLAALVMRGPINAVGPMAPVVRDVFDLPWEAFGVLAGIPTMAFGLCSLAVLPLVAGFGSRTFAVAALTGAALGSLVRCIEWMPALFLGTLILSVSIAGLNVWVPSVIKVVFHDRQSQVMGVYTAVLSISGLLGTASVMPALEAGGVWWGPFAVWGLAALAPLVWAVGFGGVPLPVPERKEKRLEKSGAPVALLVWFVAIQAGLTFTVASMMPSGLEVAGFSRPDAVNDGTFYLGAMFAGSLGCGFLPVARTIYPVVGAVYLTGLWIWMEGVGGFAGLMGAALVMGVLQGAFVTISLTAVTKKTPEADILRVTGLVQCGGYLLAGLAPMMAGAWASAFGFGRMPVLLMILVLMWCVVAWLVAGRPDATDGAPRRKCACLP